MREDRICRELTIEGKLVCALAGMLEEISVFLVFGIHFGRAPIPVTLFLWFLFAVLTAAAMIKVDELKRTVHSVYIWRERSLATGEARPQKIYRKAA